MLEKISLNSDLNKQLILLSAKSSGSSALQKYFVINYGANLVKHTNHHENETLFWTKAASILELPQDKMVYSRIPYSVKHAERELISFINENLLLKLRKLNSKKEILSFYHEIVLRNAPFFFEKSPHHLFNWSNIELILDSISHMDKNVNTKIIGLVRNPLDTMYSALKRWKYPPELFEKEWLDSYTNLVKLKKLFPHLVDIFKYEEVAKDNTILDKWAENWGLSPLENNTEYHIHRKSISRWEKDTRFGYQLSSETINLATFLGYTEDELTNSYSLIWSLNSLFYNARYNFHKVKRRLSEKH